MIRAKRTSLSMEKKANAESWVKSDKEMRCDEMVVKAAVVCRASNFGKVKGLAAANVTQLRKAAVRIVSKLERQGRLW